jgi:hypothetical protein
LVCKLPKSTLWGVTGCTTTLVMTSTNTEHAEQQSHHFDNRRPQNQVTEQVWKGHFNHGRVPKLWNQIVMQKILITDIKSLKAINYYD